MLGPNEQRLFAKFRAPKRQHDWLLGRWTGKRLLQEALGRECGPAPALESIEILPDSTGAPRVRLGAHAWLPSGLLSLSHSGTAAVAALAPRPLYGDASTSADYPGAIGVDLEAIEPRSPGFVADYFTEEEIRQVEEAVPDERDLMVNVIWSAKEAALKALRLGLTVDTRTVSCQIAPRLLEDSGVYTWGSIAVRSALPLPGCRLVGWWRQWGTSHVLTLITA